MTGRGRWLAGSFVPVATVAIWVAAFAPPLSPTPRIDDVVWAVPFIALPVVGLAVVWHQPGNRIGWLLSGIGLCTALAMLQFEVLRLAQSSADRGGLISWLVMFQPFSIVAYGLVVLVLLTFPDGTLPSRAWRWVVVALGAFLCLVALDQAISPTRRTPGLPDAALTMPGLSRLLDPVTSFNVNGALLLVGVIGMGSRYRSATGVGRQQIKWVAVAGCGLVSCAVAGGVLNAATGRHHVQAVLQSTGLLCLVAGLGIAIVRNHLYDVDLVISRGIASVSLALLTTLMYVGLVVGAGALVGRDAGADLVLPLLAAVLVAVVFRPLQTRLQFGANRLVYGRRQAPYDALAGFTRRLADSHFGDVSLQQMADSLAEGVSARVATVSLHTPGTAPVVAIAPQTADVPDTAPDQTFAVRHREETLGSLDVWSANGTSFNPTELRLLSDLAVQAGLVLHNARLTAELQQRLAELRASRRRLANAQDVERRRVERDLHDGAQHDLVALRMKLGLAEREARDSGSRLAGILAEVRDETGAALENIRRLARGLYPPLLESQGLAAALTAHSRRLPLQVDLHVAERRLGREVETAVYFCCVEALQNTTKHTSAEHAWIRIDSTADQLTFEVGDDGCGFDPTEARNGSGLQHMSDRVEALGGTINILSGVEGTQVRGVVTGAPGP